ncbi:MAG: hypothetical protein J6K42_03490 [Clostridia bacterium]|nr:hypothetical protein [Clostridia bacterium]
MGDGESGTEILRPRNSPSPILRPQNSPSPFTKRSFCDILLHIDFKEMRYGINKKFIFKY